MSAQLDMLVREAHAAVAEMAAGVDRFRTALAAMHASGEWRRDRFASFEQWAEIHLGMPADRVASFLTPPSNPHH